MADASAKPRQFLQVRVKPNARSSVLERQPDGSWLAHLKSPPLNGKANQELVALVAHTLQCAKSDVTIKSGAGARMKLIQIK